MGNDHKQHGCASTHEQLGYPATWGQCPTEQSGAPHFLMPLPTEVGRRGVSATGMSPRSLISESVTLATPVWCHKRGHKACPLPGQLPSPGTQPLHCTSTAMPSPSQGFPEPHPLRGATIHSTFSIIKLRITYRRRGNYTARFATSATCMWYGMTGHGLGWGLPAFFQRRQVSAASCL